MPSTGPAGRGAARGATIMGLIVGYVAAAIVFLGLDAVWLNVVARPMFERNLGAFLLDSPRFPVAAVFYAVYVAGIVYFAVGPAVSAGAAGRALVNGALLGFIAYGTYEATNMATLKGWTYEMMIVDTAWGAALTAVSALAGYGAWRWIAG